MPFWSSWVIFILWNFTPKQSKKGEIHLGWPYFTYREQKTARHFLGGWVFFKFLSSDKGFCRKWTPQSPRSRLKHHHSTVVWFFETFQSDESSPILSFDSYKSMKDHIEQTKDPSHKSHHNPRSRNAVLLAYATTLLLLQHTLTFSEGAIVKLNVTSHERRRRKWSQFLLAAKDRCYEQHQQIALLAVQSLNQSNLTSAHADCILFRPLKFGWSTHVCTMRSTLTHLEVTHGL